MMVNKFAHGTFSRADPFSASPVDMGQRSGGSSADRAQFHVGNRSTSFGNADAPSVTPNSAISSFPRTGSFPGSRDSVNGNGSHQETPTRRSKDINPSPFWEAGGGGGMGSASLGPLYDEVDDKAARIILGHNLTLAYREEQGSRSRRAKIFNPNSRFFRSWDIWMAVLLLFTASITPFEVSFLSTKFNALFIINRVVDVCFIMDMFFNFLMPFQNDVGKWVYDEQSIVLKYMKGWFPVDVISILPYDAVGFITGDESASNLKVLRVLRLMRLAKLLRILRAGRMFQRWEATFNINYAKMALIKFVFIITGLAHWLACTWHLLATIQAGDFSQGLDEGESEWTQTWVSSYSYVTEDDDVWARYSVSTYWSVATLATLGYGDIVPTTGIERFYASVCAMLGATVYAYLIGNVCSIVSGLDENNAKFYAMMDSLNTFMAEKQLPQPLRAALRDYFRFQRHNTPSHNSQQLLHAMSPILRAEVCEHLHAKWITAVPCFSNCGQDFVVAVTMVLYPETYGSNEAVIRTGMPADRMFIVEKGVVMMGSGGVLTGGRTFGEEMMFSSLHSRQAGLHTYSQIATTLTNSAFLVLTLEHLMRILEDFPLERRRLRRFALFRVFRQTILSYARSVKHITEQWPSSTYEDWYWEITKCGGDAGLLPYVYGAKVEMLGRHMDNSPDVMLAAVRLQAAARMFIARRRLMHQKYIKIESERSFQKLQHSLNVLGMQRHENIFRRENVTMEMVKTMGASDMRVMGIPWGDGFRLLEHLADEGNEGRRATNRMRAQHAEVSGLKGLVQSTAARRDDMAADEQTGESLNKQVASSSRRSSVTGFLSRKLLGSAEKMQPGDGEGGFGSVSLMGSIMGRRGSKVADHASSAESLSQKDKEKRAKHVAFKERNWSRASSLGVPGGGLTPPPSNVSFVVAPGGSLQSTPTRGGVPPSGSPSPGPSSAVGGASRKKLVGHSRRGSGFGSSAAGTSALRSASDNVDQPESEGVNNLASGYGTFSAAGDGGRPWWDRGAGPKDPIQMAEEMKTKSNRGAPPRMGF